MGDKHSPESQAQSPSVLSRIEAGIRGRGWHREDMNGDAAGQLLREMFTENAALEGAAIKFEKRSSVRIYGGYMIVEPLKMKVSRGLASIEVSSEGPMSLRVKDGSLVVVDAPRISMKPNLLARPFTKKFQPEIEEAFKDPDAAIKKYLANKLLKRGIEASNIRFLSLDEDDSFPLFIDGKVKEEAPSPPPPAVAEAPLPPPPLPPERMATVEEELQLAGTRQRLAELAKKAKPAPPPPPSAVSGEAASQLEEATAGERLLDRLAGELKGQGRSAGVLDQAATGGLMRDALAVALEEKGARLQETSGKFSLKIDKTTTLPAATLYSEELMVEVLHGDERAKINFMLRLYNDSTIAGKFVAVPYSVECRSTSTTPSSEKFATDTKKTILEFAQKPQEAVVSYLRKGLGERGIDLREAGLFFDREGSFHFNLTGAEKPRETPPVEKPKERLPVKKTPVTPAAAPAVALAAAGGSPETKTGKMESLRQAIEQIKEAVITTLRGGLDIRTEDFLPIDYEPPKETLQEKALGAIEAVAEALKLGDILPDLDFGPGGFARQTERNFGKLVPAADYIAEPMIRLGHLLEMGPPGEAIKELGRAMERIETRRALGEEFVSEEQRELAEKRRTIAKGKMGIALGIAEDDEEEIMRYPGYKEALPWRATHIISMGEEVERFLERAGGILPSLSPEEGEALIELIGERFHTERFEPEEEITAVGEEKQDIKPMTESDIPVMSVPKGEITAVQESFGPSREEEAIRNANRAIAALLSHKGLLAGAGIILLLIRFGSIFDVPATPLTPGTTLAVGPTGVYTPTIGIGGTPTPTIRTDLISALNRQIISETAKIGGDFKAGITNWITREVPLLAGWLMSPGEGTGGGPVKAAPQIETNITAALNTDEFLKGKTAALPNAKEKLPVIIGVVDIPFSYKAEQQRGGPDIIFRNLTNAYSNSNSKDIAFTGFLTSTNWSPETWAYLGALEKVAASRGITSSEGLSLTLITQGYPAEDCGVLTDLYKIYLAAKNNQQISLPVENRNRIYDKLKKLGIPVASARTNNFVAEMPPIDTASVATALRKAENGIALGRGEGEAIVRAFPALAEKIQSRISLTAKEILRAKQVTGDFPEAVSLTDKLYSGEGLTLRELGDLFSNKALSHFVGKEATAALLGTRLRQGLTVGELAGLPVNTELVRSPWLAKLGLRIEKAKTPEELDRAIKGYNTYAAEQERKWGLPEGLLVRRGFPGKDTAEETGLL